MSGLLFTHCRAKAGTWARLLASSPLLLAVLGCDGLIKSPKNIPAIKTDVKCDNEATPLRRITHEEYRRTVQAAFPTVAIPEIRLPEDQSPYGYDNDHGALGVNALLIGSYLSTAQELGLLLAPHALSRVDCGGRGARECGWVFASYWEELLYRKPPTEEQIGSIAALFVEGEALETNAAVAVQAMLLDPDFLYHIEHPVASTLEPGAYLLDGWSIAARLSYTLWRAPPDAALREAARNGKLGTEDEIRSQIARLLSGPLARRGVRHFFSQWLDLGRLDTTDKLPEDGFDEATRQSMREETLQLIEYLVFETPGTVQDILTSRETFIDDRMASLYGMPMPGNEGHSKAAAPPERRGVLTHASFLASHAHPGYKSPVLRGSFILRNILCEPLGAPPPEAEGSMVPTDDQTLATNRERYDSVTLQSEQCAACHRQINNAGYAFEGFDTMGRKVFEEGGTAIDTSGRLGQMDYTNAQELVQQLGQDPRVSSCLAQNFLRYAYGGSSSGLSPCVRQEILEQMKSTSGTLKDLIITALSHPEFRTLRIDPAPEQT